MKIDVAWTPSELRHFAVHERVPVVVDVLRAATAITTALHNGARAVLPVESIEEGMRIANSIGRRDVVLCGERGGVPIEGFDLGNSPQEFTPEVVGGRTLVMTTTNGTQALGTAATAPVVYVAALVNMTAVSRHLLGSEGDPLIICAGREGRVSAEDALCAGLIVRTVAGPENEERPDMLLGDGAIAARALAAPNAPVDAGFLRRTAAGRALEATGLAADIDYCAGVDILSEVPALRERQITAVKRASTTGGERVGG